MHEDGSLCKEEAAIDESMVDKWPALEGKMTAAAYECTVRVSPGRGVRGTGKNRSAKEQDDRGSNPHEQPPFCWRSENNTIRRSGAFDFSCHDLLERAGFPVRWQNTANDREGRAPDHLVVMPHCAMRSTSPCHGAAGRPVWTGSADASRHAERRIERAEGCAARKVLSRVGITQ
jgi:hypothetical protein